MIWKTFFIFTIDMWLVNSMEERSYPSRNPLFWGYFSPPTLQREPSKPNLTPLEKVVDITNDLGVAILQDHSYSRGNFAFSPYGVASVLVILYEGARGESARQIHRALRFPFDKEIIRVGFKDLHQHLKSYFNHEGFLSGITLNKDGSRLEPEYRKILKYYGYNVDLSNFIEDNNEMEKMNETAASSSTKTPTTVSNIPEIISNEKPAATTEIIPTEKPASTTEIISTKEPSATTEIISTEEPTTTTEETDLKNSTALDPEKTTSVQTTTTDPMPTTTDILLNKPNENESQIEVSKCRKNDTEFNFEKETDCTDDDSGNKDIENHQNNLEEQTVNNQQKENSTVSNLGESLSLSSTTSNVDVETSTSNEIISGLENGMLIPQPSVQESTSTATTITEQSTTTETDNNLTTSKTTTINTTETTTELTTEEEEEEEEEEVHEQKYLEKKTKAIFSEVKVALKDNKKLGIRRKKTITDYLKSPREPDLSLQLRNGMYDAHVFGHSDFSRSLPKLLFLLDGVVDTPVPMMTFTTVFPFAYIPRLHAKALEFPLDRSRGGIFSDTEGMAPGRLIFFTDYSILTITANCSENQSHFQDIRYKLLILLPIETKGLRRLIYDLTDFSVRDVVKSLRPTRVKTTVPTFMVEGFVILTSSLQKLGISDVFDPRRSNLSGMSSEPDLYVRNIEQSVTVVIRNYVEILDVQTRTMAARNMEEEFEAVYPFLYFVLDASTNAALMAGQLLNPLNSRMY